MLEQLQAIVSSIIESQLEVMDRKQNTLHSNYEKLNNSQFKKLEQTFKENQIAKWSHQKYTCAFYNEEKTLFLRQQIESLFNSLNEMPQIIAVSVMRKLDEVSENQNNFSFSKGNEQFSFNQGNNFNLSDYIAEQEKALRDEIMVKEVQNKNDTSKIRMMRIEKIEIAQQLKQLIIQYEDVLKQNQKQQDKIKSLEMDVKKLSQLQDQTTYQLFQRQKNAQIQIIPAQLTEKSTSNLFIEQKINHLEHCSLKQQEMIAQLQQQNQQLQQQLQQEQLMNHNMYSNLVNLNAQSENVIYMKNVILNEIEGQQDNINQRQILSKANQSRKESPQNQMENNEKQWNRLILHISKLQNEKQMLIERVVELLNEIFKSSQFLLNLLDLMDKPDFIVNLKSIRNICTQQREVVSDRLIEIVRERQILGDQQLKI